MASRLVTLVILVSVIFTPIHVVARDWDFVRTLRALERLVGAYEIYSTTASTKDAFDNFVSQLNGEPLVADGKFVERLEDYARRMNASYEAPTVFTAPLHGDDFLSYDTATRRRALDRANYLAREERKALDEIAADARELATIQQNSERLAHWYWDFAAGLQEVAGKLFDPTNQAPTRALAASLDAEQISRLLGDIASRARLQKSQAEAMLAEREVELRHFNDAISTLTKIHDARVQTHRAQLINPQRDVDAARAREAEERAKIEAARRLSDEIAGMTSAMAQESARAAARSAAAAHAATSSPSAPEPPAAPLSSYIRFGSRDQQQRTREPSTTPPNQESQQPPATLHLR